MTCSNLSDIQLLRPLTSDCHTFNLQIVRCSLWESKTGNDMFTGQWWRLKEPQGILLFVRWCKLQIFDFEMMSWPDGIFSRQGLILGSLNSKPCSDGTLSHAFSANFSSHIEMLFSSLIIHLQCRFYVSFQILRFSCSLETSKHNKQWHNMSWFFSLKISTHVSHICRNWIHQENILNVLEEFSEDATTVYSFSHK